MAVKIVHRERDQEIRFANRESAVRYATTEGGGLARWVIVTIRDERSGKVGSGGS